MKSKLMSKVDYTLSSFHRQFFAIKPSMLYEHTTFYNADILPTSTDGNRARLIKS